MAVKHRVLPTLFPVVTPRKPQANAGLSSVLHKSSHLDLLLFSVPSSLTSGNAFRPEFSTLHLASPSLFPSGMLRILSVLSLHWGVSHHPSPHLSSPPTHTCSETALCGGWKGGERPPDGEGSLSLLSSSSESSSFSSFNGRFNISIYQTTVST